MLVFRLLLLALRYYIPKLLQFYSILPSSYDIGYCYTTRVLYFPAWFKVYICELEGFPEGLTLDSRSIVKIRITSLCSNYVVPNSLYWKRGEKSLLKICLL